MNTDQTKQFKQSVHALNELLREVRVKYPEASYYLAGDTLHLMSGSSHDAAGDARRDLSLVQAHLSRSGGGDW